MKSIEDIQKATVAALKAGDSTRKDTLRLVLSAVKQLGIDERRVVTAEEIEAIIVKQAKQRRDSISQFSKAGRDDLVAKEEKELAVLETLMPKLMTREEIAAEVTRILAETGASGPKAMGTIMREFLGRHKGRADGRLVQEVAKEAISEGSH